VIRLERVIEGADPFALRSPCLLRVSVIRLLAHPIRKDYPPGQSHNGPDDERALRGDEVNIRPCEKGEEEMCKERGGGGEKGEEEDHVEGERGVWVPSPP